ncbi:MAG: hypothetical protein K9M82_06605 [Deltaproteobacteria bacterium]|nr:hypothetical protein [Deltaproteobacteria bacterium]
MQTWKKILFVGTCGVLALVLLEGICRTEWSLRAEAPFLSPNLYFYYPELRAVLEAEEGGEGDLDVLLLGGSVLHEDWGTIPQTLQERLTLAARREVRVHNLARPGHTTLDSWYKYRRAAARDFDLVLVYHGINELRLNNCPEDVFRPDYGHYSWYRVINRFERRPGWPDLALLYALIYRGTRLHEKVIAPDAYISRDRPEDSMVRFGGEIKTVQAFQRNLTSLLDLARERKQPVILMTFCSYLPENYTLERFQEGALDYCLHSCAVEIWGEREHVVKGLQAHNRVIRNLEERFSEGVRLVDQEERMPRGRDYFNDVCHLTQRGCDVFVENIVRGIGDLLPPGGPAGGRGGEPAP